MRYYDASYPGTNREREQLRTSLHGQVYGLGRLRVLEGLGHLGQELGGKCVRNCVEVVISPSL